MNGFDNVIKVIIINGCFFIVNGDIVFLYMFFYGIFIYFKGFGYFWYSDFIIYKIL